MPKKQKHLRWARVAASASLVFSIMSILSVPAIAEQRDNFEPAMTGAAAKAIHVVPGVAREEVLQRQVASNQGAFLFWVRPQAKRAGENSSFALLSLRWQDTKPNYLALSQGWWEPLYRDKLIFIVSNQAGAFCVSSRPLVLSRWTHVIASWSSSAAGSMCRLYLDGVRVAATPMPSVGLLISARNIFLGSDRGATDQRTRDALGEFRGFRSLASAVGDRDAARLYAQAVPDEHAIAARTLDWAAAYVERPLASLTPSRETRALLDESWQWARSPADVDELVRVAAKAGFNVIVPCVWHGRGTAYPSRIAHLQPELQNPKAQFDPLSYLISRAHERRIQVHPWFTVVRREDDLHPEFYDPGTPSDAYDIHRAGFRQFAADLIGDVARRYAIDGVHLDYVRAMGICQSDFCAQSYRAFSARELTRDLAQIDVDAVARASIERWQDGDAYRMVTSIVSEVRVARPKAMISMSGSPVPAGVQRALQGRDEMRWLHDHLVDAVFAMEYELIPDHDRVAAVAAELTDPAQLLWSFADFSIIDDVAESRSADVLQTYVKFARARVPGSGIAIYLRSMLSAAQIDALREGVFATAVPPRWFVGEKRRERL